MDTPGHLMRMENWCLLYPMAIPLPLQEDSVRAMRIDRPLEGRAGKGAHHHEDRVGNKVVELEAERLHHRVNDECRRLKHETEAL